MKYLFLLCVSIICTIANADVNVRPYSKKGVVVRPHHRTNPNNNKWDNYSSKGNTNPYTGKKGTKAVGDYPIRGAESN